MTGRRRDWSPQTSAGLCPGAEQREPRCGRKARKDEPARCFPGQMTSRIVASKRLIRLPGPHDMVARRARLIVSLVAVVWGKCGKCGRRICSKATSSPAGFSPARRGRQKLFEQMSGQVSQQLARGRRMRRLVDLTTSVRRSDQYNGNHSDRSWEKLVIIPAALLPGSSRAESRSENQSSGEMLFATIRVARDYYVTERAS